MVSLTSNGNKGDGGEQNFSKVHGSRLGWSSSDVLSNCRRAALKFFISIPLCLPTPRYLSYSDSWVNILYCPHCSSWLHCISACVVMATLTYTPKLLHFLSTIPSGYGYIKICTSTILKFYHYRPKCVTSPPTPIVDLFLACGESLHSQPSPITFSKLILRVQNSHKIQQLII
jgi:hypothetical protein